MLKPDDKFMERYSNAELESARRYAQSLAISCQFHLEALNMCILSIGSLPRLSTNPTTLVDKSCP